MLLEALKQAYPFAMYGWSHAPSGDYGVLSWSGGADFEANGIHAERGTEGTVDLFTRDASSTPRDSIEEILNAECPAWSLNTIQFETDTGYIHYEWVVGLYG